MSTNYDPDRDVTRQDTGTIRHAPRDRDATHQVNRDADVHQDTNLHRDTNLNRDADLHRDADTRRDVDATQRIDRPVEHDRTLDRPVEHSMDRGSVVAREREQYGGIKIGSAFFGWLTATGTAVLLTALLAAAGTALSLATDTAIGDAADRAVQDPETIGIAGAIGLLVILFVSYYCGGYVAGRMARFNGAKQGIAVWLWAVVIAGVVALVAAIAGDEFDVLARLDSFPRIPVTEGDLTTAGIVTLLAVALASLVGAVLGGMAGMHFHRKVDRAGLEPPVTTTSTTTER